MSNSETSSITLPKEERFEEKDHNTVEQHHQQQQQHDVKQPIHDAEKGATAPEVAANGDSPKPFNPMDPANFPEGGRDAWLCVAGASACLFASFGWINVVGVFTEYYLNGPLREYSASTVGWIVSTETFFMLFCSPFTGWWFDNYGPRYLLLLGTFMHVFGLMMTSLSTKYYQIFLSQSVCSAIGASMLFSPGMSCVATWFNAKRGQAISLVAAGSSLGGVLFPIIVSRMIPRDGFGWAMRTCAFIILGLMIFANLTVKSRIAPRGRKFELMAFVRPLKEPSFVLLTISTILFYFGMFIPFSFIVTDAVAHGMSPALGAYLVSILNAVSIFGRTLPGILGDKIGRFNVMIVMCLISGVLILGLWIPSSSNAAFIVFSALFGFSSGAAVSLTPALVAQISDIRQIGVRTGTIFGISSIAALTGTPIGGALVSHNSDPFFHAKIFAGVLTLSGCCFYVATRIALAGPSLMKKV